MTIQYDIVLGVVGRWRLLDGCHLPERTERMIRPAILTGPLDEAGQVQVVQEYAQFIEDARSLA